MCKVWFYLGFIVKFGIIVDRYCFVIFFFYIFIICRSISIVDNYGGWVVNKLFIRYSGGIRILKKVGGKRLRVWGFLDIGGFKIFF